MRPLLRTFAGIALLLAVLLLPAGAASARSVTAGRLGADPTTTTGPIPTLPSALAHQPDPDGDTSDNSVLLSGVGAGIFVLAGGTWLWVRQRRQLAREPKRIVSAADAVDEP